MARGLLVWLLIILAETVHGVLRGLFLVPRIGEDWSARLGWPVGAALVLTISVVTIRWTGLTGTGALLRLGAVWAVLTVLFELAIGLLRGLEGAALITALDPSSGTIPWSAGLMLFAPLIATWVRRRR